MQGKVTISDVKSGIVTLSDLLKINAMLDAEAATREMAEDEARKENNR